MSKIILSLILLCFMFKGVDGQQPGNAYTKGSSVITLGYGIGNVWKQYLKEGISFPENYTFSTNGAFGLTYEYGIMEKFSLGVIIGYSVLEGKYSTGNQVLFIDKLTNFAVLLRANYHYVKWGKVDPYIGGGLGYYNFKYEALDATGSPVTLNDRVPGAFGYSIQIGARYYFSPVFGCYAEFGYLGGSLAQVGIAAKF